MVAFCVLMLHLLTHDSNACSLIMKTKTQTTEKMDYNSGTNLEYVFTNVVRGVIVIYSG